MTITGAHVLLYTTDPDSDRAFFRDVLGFRWVDAGRGWLIFGLPPSELALHPIDNQAAPADTASAVLYLMCDDVEATVRSLESKGVSCAPLRRPNDGASGLRSGCQVARTSDSTSRRIPRVASTQVLAVRAVRLQRSPNGVGLRITTRAQGRPTPAAA